MYQRMTHESQSNPLLPGYSFNAYLVAGLTPILADGPLYFFIDRPDGMKGYIINLTIKGQGRVSNRGSFVREYCHQGGGECLSTGLKDRS